MTSALQTNRSRIKSRSINTSINRKDIRCKSQDNSKEMTLTNIELDTPKKLEAMKRTNSVSRNTKTY